MKRITFLLVVVAMVAGVAAGRAQTSTGTDVKPALQSAKEVRGTTPYIEINNEPFMVVQFSGMTSRVGYIHLASVRAILPTGAPRPNRSAELRKY